MQTDFKHNANETGLTDRYDIRLNWKMSKGELEGRSKPDPDAVIAAVRDQLGLGVSLQRRLMPVLVAEKAASPSAGSK